MNNLSKINVLWNIVKIYINLLLASLDDALVSLTEGVGVSWAEADKQKAASVINANNVFESLISLEWAEKSLNQDVLCFAMGFWRAYPVWQTNQ